MKSPLAVMRRFGWRQWLIVAAFAGALLFAGVQVVGFAQHAVSLRAMRNDPIAPWMTVGHVAHAFHVDEEILEEAIGIPVGSHYRRPLRLLALQRGETFEVVRARLEAAIAAASVPGPPPRPPSSDVPPGTR